MGKLRREDVKVGEDWKEEHIKRGKRLKKSPLIIFIKASKMIRKRKDGSDYGEGNDL